MKTYGPYKRKDGRFHVIHIYDDGTRQTQSWPRYLMEQHLGRKLESWEQVDHIDQDISNNSIDNFQLLTARQHALKTNKHNGRSIGHRMMPCVCPHCGEDFELKFKHWNSAQKLGKKTFCSRSCAGRAVGGRRKKSGPLV